MDRLATHPEKRKGLQTIFVSLIVGLVIVLAVGAAIYYLNLDNEIIPDANQAIPFDTKD